MEDEPQLAEDEPGSPAGHDVDDVLQKFAAAEVPTVAIYDRQAVRAAGSTVVAETVTLDEADHERPAERVSGMALPLQGMATELIRDARRGL